MNASTPRYNGIAIFGAPGSGKTTIARLLTHELPNTKRMEASECVIYPALAIQEKLPKTERQLFQVLEKQYGKKGTRASRDQARDFFTYLKHRYSSSVIAKSLIHLQKKRFPKKFPVIAGIRGYGNSMHFKRNGYLVIHLTAPAKELNRRITNRENFSQKSAETEKEMEERLFSTNKIEAIAHLTFNTAAISKKEIVSQVRAISQYAECRKCPNASINLSSVIDNSGLCSVCEAYDKNFDPRLLKTELRFLLSLKGSGTGAYDALVGISGGKDSTATLFEAQRLGFKPLAFSLDTGYYPTSIFSRAKHVAHTLGVGYTRIDVRKYIRPADRASFQKTAALYDERESERLKEKFKKWYGEGRRHYSIKCAHKIPFVRTCQLCRRIIVRSYYREALRHGVRVVILGMNEWAGLSQDNRSKKVIFSAIRKLQPFKNRPAVYIVHLPFLLQRTIEDTERTLKKLGWKIPRGERLIESNANSCLFARAAENKARRMLGFHPDTTRLAREVTVGFITKAQAHKALSKIHNYPLSVSGVLKRARVI